MRSRLILASGSPRRQQLLAAAGFRFEVAQPTISESASQALTIRELAILNAVRKGLEISRRHPDAVVLAADTLVGFEGDVIGKPSDFEDAVRILQRLRGRTHQVCTGVFVGCSRLQNSNSFCVVSQVRFRSLTDGEVCRYLEKIEPLDKAGAYAAQGHGRDIIEELRGSYTNVVGLPMDETVRALRAFKIRPERKPKRTQFTGVRQQISSLFPSGSSKKNA